MGENGNLVIIESPFKGEDYKETALNVLYARACVHDSLLRGELPFASHLFYTQNGILNDQIKLERDIGIKAGFAWGKIARKRVIYTDRGISEGMKEGINEAEKIGQKVIHRTLPKYEEFLKRMEEMNFPEGYTFVEQNGKFSENLNANM